MLFSMQNGNENGLIVVEFAKAFGKAAHNGLLYKLKICDVKGKTLTWIRAFHSEHLKV